MGRLEQELGELDDEPNSLRRIARCQERVKAAIQDAAKIEGFNQVQSDAKNSILFLKELIPSLESKLIFYRLYFELEMHKQSSTSERHKAYCEEKLCVIRDWQLKNREFIEYYYSGREDLDHCEFVVKKEGSGMVSTLLGYQEFTKTLKSELEDEVHFEPATWTGTATDLVEQIMGEYATGHTQVNGKPVTYDYLVARAQKMYPNVSLQNFEGIVADIRRRQEGPTTYHAMKIKLMKEKAQELLDGRKKSKK